MSVAMKIPPAVVKRVTRGEPRLGASVVGSGTNFGVVTDADAITLVIDDGEGPQRIEVDGEYQTGTVLHCHVDGVGAGARYHYERFIGGEWRRLIDPYARALSGVESWAPRTPEHPATGVVVPVSAFDWQNTRPPKRAWEDTIIYEVHVRGFTNHPSAKVDHPGTYAALVQKIPFLSDLGVTAVELLPVFEFIESENERRNPDTGEELCNYWGYSPISFFAPKAAYASVNEPLSVLNEFRDMVRAFHASGIEVILDVVFNHTGPASLKYLAPEIYYIHEPDGSPTNYSGCGNTLNCNHPVVADLIVDALRHWAIDMGVDGFRFDLASIMSRGQHGEVLTSPSVLERIS
ncbi:MAG: alpha-amylase family glycosyl hydrolase, partial [Pseudomonadota bacterium]